MNWSLHGPSRGTVAATTLAPVRSASRAAPSGTAIFPPKKSTSMPPLGLRHVGQHSDNLVVAKRAHQPQAEVPGRQDL